MYLVLILSVCEFIDEGEEWAVSGCRVIYVEKSPFWLVIMVLYRPRSVALSLLNVCISGVSLSIGDVEVVTVGKCYIFYICFFDSFVQHKYIWPMFMGRSGSFYGTLIGYTLKVSDFSRYLLQVSFVTFGYRHHHHHYHYPKIARQLPIFILSNWPT